MRLGRFLRWLFTDDLVDGFESQAIAFLDGWLENTPQRARERGILLVVGIFTVWTFLGLLLNFIVFKPIDGTGLAQSATVAAATSIPTLSGATPSSAPTAILPGTASTNLTNPAGPIDILWQIYFSNHMLPFLVLLVLPFFLALEYAGIYQKDIYDLAKVSTARRFLMQAAFRFPRFENLQINAEKLTREQSLSPIAMIGGPGIVSPDLEYAVIFELPDGSPHYIRANMPVAQRTLAGFERLRRIIDTRSHTYHFDRITGRTKDGIKISIQDITFLFSVWREPLENEDGPNRLTNPYPVQIDDVVWLTYQQENVQWVNAITILIEKGMLQFIREHTFGALLAAIGEPEDRQLAELDTAVQGLSWREPLRRPLQFIFHAVMPVPPPHPEPVPRPQLRNFFQEFTRKFQEEVGRKVLRLEWINVGTFHTEEEVVLSQHVEAWRLTTQNLIRNSAQRKREFRNTAQIKETIQILRQTPLLTFTSLTNQGQSRNSVLAAMLQDYNTRLRDYREKFYRQSLPVPPALESAISTINDCLTGLIAPETENLSNTGG